ncbi:hypothetical protein H8356DRAFT_1382224 [Neocallimastix lanati (nom. inval.)]|nr:hypothetical protein H8356DRAFT_1382224 [Neocallimastix sp. JGI-2020a]
MNNKNNNIPNEYLCPITKDIMREPFHMPDGLVYEKEAIKLALEKIHISPITKMEMKLSDGYINDEIKDLINNYIKENNIELINIDEKIKNLKFAEILTENSLKLKCKEIENIEFEELFAHYISKERRMNLCDNFIHVCMKPKKVKTTLPVCLFCVVDISNSMSINCCKNIESLEAIEITRLELIKHSLKTIVSSLRKEDIICVIEFGSNAKITVHPTELSNKIIKEDVIEKINKMCTSGMTNMWAGIKLAIENINSIPYKNYQKSIMIFTDGDSNSNPPEGVYRALQNTLKNNDDQFTISTFSYGNDVKEDLLIDIANLGNGVYGYCSDGTMVGTVFINYMANILSMITPITKITLNQNDKVIESKIIGPLYRGTYRNAIFQIDNKKYLKNIKKTKITLEFPIIGQKFDVPLNLDVVDIQKYIDDKSELEEKDKEIQNASDSDDELLDEESDEEETDIKIKDIDTDLLIEEKDSVPIQYEEILLNQILRNKFINILKIITNTSKLGSNKYQNQKTKNILNKFFEFLKQLKYKNKFIKSLIIDINHPDPNHGQVDKAIDLKYYNKWGKSYISSLLRFHEFEQCGNFKDESLQYYSHEIFNIYRRMANNIFINLPPPKARKINRFRSHDYGKGSGVPIMESLFGFLFGRKKDKLVEGSVTRSRNIDDKCEVEMRSFLNRRGGCFDGNSSVLLADGRIKCVKDLKKGDILNNNAIVQCLIKQNIKKISNPYMCNVDGVLFTPYHPIFIRGKWQFPIDIVQSQPTVIHSLFNLILNDNANKKYEIEFINGVKAITLGHNRNENKILKHPYFGTDLVLKDLYERDPEGYFNGYIFIKDLDFHQLKYDDNQYCINYYKIKSSFNIIKFKENKIIKNIDVIN